MRVLVVRPDRLGDVILSTPVLSVIKANYPNCHLVVMVKSGVESLLKGLPSVDEVMIYDPDGSHAGVGGFFRLLREIRERKFRIAVVLQTNWRIAAAAFFARIRYRVGPLAKIHSFLFFNRGLRQHRSLVEMHETDYNLQLLRRIGIRVGSRSVLTSVHVSESIREDARRWLERMGWKGPGPRNAGEPLVIVHPGMGGSALNWPETHYVELIRALLREGRKVLVTAGPTEGQLLDRVRAALGDLKDKVMIYGGPGIGGVEFLGGLYSWAHLVVAPSTGPLHLAVALGRPVLTFYPPIRVQSAIRWGPYVPDETRTTIMTPEVYCGEDFRCRGNLCNYFPCMKGVLVTQVAQKANELLTVSLSEEGTPRV
ncbi:MAG TPA: glycosyltransferase family 9 protein [Bdellovibrionota bacterium]|nr:glycosyltransferase family 9 protein [Bdellovibrionota bacterium]